MKLNSGRECIVRLSITVMVVLFSVLWVALTAVAAEGEAIVVTGMEWKARTSELRIKGTGAGQKEIVIKRKWICLLHYCVLISAMVIL